MVLWQLMRPIKHILFQKGINKLSRSCYTIHPQQPLHKQFCSGIHWQNFTNVPIPRQHSTRCWKLRIVHWLAFGFQTPNKTCTTEHASPLVGTEGCESFINELWLFTPQWSAGWGKTVKRTFRPVAWVILINRLSLWVLFLCFLSLCCLWLLLLLPILESGELRRRWWW